MGLFKTDYIPRSVLPPRRVTENTIRNQGGKLTNCPQCGAAFVDGKDFCVECGAKRLQRHTLQMPVQRTKAVELAKYLTDWLAQNPYLANVSLSCDLRHMDNDFDRVGQVSATNVSLSYAIFDGENNNQYGVEYVYSYKATFNFMEVQNCTAKTLVERWQELNPDLTKVDWTGGRVTCASNGTYQLYALILYKKDVSGKASAPTPAPAPEAPKVAFCRHCGQKITTAGAFCNQCGGKL